jgi:tetratricopeptide (TPR) repeat protein
VKVRARLERLVVAADAAASSLSSEHAASRGVRLLNKVWHTGNGAGLDEAIDLLRLARDTTPATHPNRAWRLTRLALALQTPFDRVMDPADLDEAIDAARGAVEAAPPRDRAGYLSNLGLALLRRFEAAGALGDLDEAIAVARQAVAATPDGDRGRAWSLSNLGLALHRRFERSGALSDLDDAIAVGREAADITPDSDPGRAAWLANLGLTLWARFERCGDPGDLDKAIDVTRQAVAATPDSDPGRAWYRSNLGIGLRTRFEQAGDLGDLDQAIVLGREAVAATPAVNSSRAAFLASLGMALRTRFEQTGDLGDLDQAIAVGREAADITPADYPGRAWYLFNLGLALQAQFEWSAAVGGLSDVISTFQQAAAVGAAVPTVRARAAIGWGQTAAAAEQWPEAVKGFAAAVELLGRVAPRSLVRRDQEDALGGLSGVASDAAACCIRAGMADRAVELLEQGRGILLGQALDARSDLADLAERHPDLAERFTALRDALDRTSDPGRRPVTQPGRAGQADNAPDVAAAEAQLEADRLRASAEAFEQVIEEVRAQPGFIGFLRPLPARSVLAATANGPVVIINVSGYGSHALILTPSGILEPVQLGQVTPDRVEEQVRELIAALDDSDLTKMQAMLVGVLGWLWDVIASPVLDRLGLTGPPPQGQPWPRLWWCLPGLLSFLPLHAAGHHQVRQGATPQSVMDRVVSSYTPTLRVLLQARAAPDPLAGEGEAVPTVLHVTSGAPDLPAAEKEAAMLPRLPGARVHTLRGPAATRDAVLQALREARWAHFAGHGSADSASPSASCLHLAGHQQLTVHDIARLRLDNADLAYLSACSTAQPGERLADEALHVASAFHLAGYRHVIGTLWPVPDRTAANIAGAVYAAMGDNQTGASAAIALHTAIRRLRERRPDQPATWASHIHVGA